MKFIQQCLLAFRNMLENRMRAHEHLVVWALMLIVGALGGIFISTRDTTPSRGSVGVAGVAYAPPTKQPDVKATLKTKVFKKDVAPVSANTTPHGADSSADAFRNWQPPKIDTIHDTITGALTIVHDTVKVPVPILIKAESYHVPFWPLSAATLHTWTAGADGSLTESTRRLHGSWEQQTHVDSLITRESRFGQLKPVLMLGGVVVGTASITYLLVHH